MPLVLERVLTLTNPLMSGADVKAVQHLLTAKGFPCVADGWFGPETGAACVGAKRRLSYVVANQTPTCGESLVAALEAHAPFKPLPVPAARVRFVAQLRAALAHKANWDYTRENDPDVRPIPHKGHQGRVRTDCSGGVTYLAECADCPDPNGLKFGGQGYTGTLYNHCDHITRAMLKPGDLVGFGGGTGHHVCAVLEIGSDPLLWSHGRQGDPREIRLSAEIAGQHRHPGVYYLRWLP